MDCGWAASAPRYPAGKTLVVNLPSVEIGSVISYRTVVTVTNAPAPFYGTYNFDTYEPVDRRVVRVNDWTRDERNLKLLPNEPAQPYSSLWRDQVVISSNRFERIDLKVGVLDPATIGATDDREPMTAEATKDSRQPTTAASHSQPSQPSQPSQHLNPSTLLFIRDWMAKNVKIAGPAMYDLPLERQLTPPETVVAERYATRLDYIRTLCALLRGAGYDADVVLGTLNEDDPEVLKNRDKYEKPDVSEFASALCRVKVTEGGWLFGLFGEEKT